jgi:hypothetical protein
MTEIVKETNIPASEGMSDSADILSAQSNTSDSHFAMEASSAEHFLGTRMNLRRHRRNTDHMYMARGRIEVSNEPPQKKRKGGRRKIKPKTKQIAANKDIDRNTDHLYNATVASQQKLDRKLRVNNRDTDHLYNIRNSAAVPTVSAVSDPTRTSVDGNEANSADKTVVDKDHMYQHNTRKAKGKGGQAMSVKKRRSRGLSGVQLQHPQSFNSDKADDQSDRDIPHCVFPVDKTVELKVKHELSDDFPTDHDYLSVKEANTCDVTGPSTVAGLQESSPAHSDFSDQICDDSRRSGVSSCDHMYVHTLTHHIDSELLAKHQPGNQGSPAEGHRQEHSYANSDEVRYDACANCSELVQQLIGTVNQQKSHIEELTKQLEVAKARNQELSLLLGQSSNSASVERCQLESDT